MLYVLVTEQLVFSELFDYELASVPSSLFEDTGKPCNLFKSCSSEKNENGSVILCNISRCCFSRWGGMLHSSIHWPEERPVEDLVVGAEKYILKTMDISDTYLVLDRYIDYSIKSEARLKCIGLFKRT